MAEKILLCGSPSLERVGLVTTLERCTELNLVSVADDAEQAILMAKELQPGLIFADMELFGLDAVERIQTIWANAGVEVASPLDGGGAERSPLPWIVLLVRVMDRRVIEVLRAGVMGALSPSCGIDEILAAIRVVLCGNLFLSSAVSRYVLDQVGGRTMTPAGDDAAHLLTRRERQILALLANGLSNAEVADRLYICESTVKYHVSQILNKLRLRDRLQAAAFAHRNGLAD